MEHGEEQRSRTGPNTDEWWESGDCWPVYSTYYDDLYRPTVSKDRSRLMGHGEATGLKKHHLFRPARTGHSTEYRYDKDMICNTCGKSYGHARRFRRTAAARREMSP